MSLQATPEILSKFAEKFPPENAEELAELAERKHREFLENGNALQPNTLYLELSSQRGDYVVIRFCDEENTVWLFDKNSGEMTERNGYGDLLE